MFRPCALDVPVMVINAVPVSDVREGQADAIGTPQNDHMHGSAVRIPLHHKDTLNEGRFAAVSRCSPEVKELVTG